VVGRVRTQNCPLFAATTCSALLPPPQGIPAQSSSRLPHRSRPPAPRTRTRAIGVVTAFLPAWVCWRMRRPSSVQADRSPVLACSWRCRPWSALGSSPVRSRSSMRRSCRSRFHHSWRHESCRTERRPPPPKSRLGGTPESGVAPTAKPVTTVEIMPVWRPPSDESARSPNPLRRGCPLRPPSRWGQKTAPPETNLARHNKPCARFTDGALCPESLLQRAAHRDADVNR